MKKMLITLLLFFSLFFPYYTFASHDPFYGHDLFYDEYTDLYVDEIIVSPGGFVYAKIQRTGTGSIPHIQTRFTMRENDRNGSLICQDFRFYMPAAPSSPVFSDDGWYKTSSFCKKLPQNNKYYIEVLVDSASEVFEVNEDNNIKELVVVVGSLDSNDEDAGNDIAIQDSTQNNKQNIVGDEIPDNNAESDLQDNTKIIVEDNGPIAPREVIAVKSIKMYDRLKGKIVIKVDDFGKAYYINPRDNKMYHLGHAEDAFAIMREQGIGISSVDLEKIPLGLDNLAGNDSDGDGLPDLFEDAIGTNKYNQDSDGDGHNDRTELLNSYNPKGAGRISHDSSFTDKHKGKIFVQVEGRGEAWYISPDNGKRYFLGRPADAFAVMRGIGLGISNSDFDNI